MNEYEVLLKVKVQAPNSEAADRMLREALDMVTVREYQSGIIGTIVIGGEDDPLGHAHSIHSQPLGPIR
jgi:hypothetical protein